MLGANAHVCRSFDIPLRQPASFSRVGARKLNALARRAVQKSLVLLKNESQTTLVSVGRGRIFLTFADPMNAKERRKGKSKRSSFRVAPQGHMTPEL